MKPALVALVTMLALLAVWRTRTHKREPKVDKSALASNARQSRARAGAHGALRVQPVP